MKYTAVTIALGFLFLAGCGSDVSQSETNNTSELQGTNEEQADEYFGEKISAAGAIPFAQLPEKLGGNDSLPVKVIATVEEVCQAKGCWMDLVDRETSQASMKVRFKDYGFFVPKDIAGRQVIVEGLAFKETTSVEELRHYAEDAGKPKEEVLAINQPKEEFKFMASGVILLND